MATDRSDAAYLCESNAEMRLSDFRNYLMRSRTQPKLSVLIPKRSGKVPQIRSKRLQQLQARPRDPNASSSLLMIAPLTDCRYRTLNRTKVTMPVRHSPSKLTAQNVDLIRSQESQHNLTQTPRIQHRLHPWQDNQTAMYSSNCVPTSEYFKQISTFAAMAFSDCSQATEKLRQIYQQTALLSQNPFSALASSYGQTQMTRNGAASLDFAKTNRLTPISRHSRLKYAASSSAQQRRVEQQSWEIPSVYCACAICQKTKRIKSSATSSQLTMNDVTPVPTSYFPSIKQQLLEQQQQSVSSRLTNPNLSRLKRALSPGDVTYCYPPARKMPKLHDQSISVAKQHTCHLEAFQRQPTGNATPSLLPYVGGTPVQQTVTDNTPQLSQNFFMSGLPSSTTSFMTSSLDGSTPRDLIVTPSFENQFFVNSQASGSAPLGGGILHGFSNFLPPPILNALE